MKNVNIACASLLYIYLDKTPPLYNVYTFSVASCKPPQAKRRQIGSYKRMCFPRVLGSWFGLKFRALKALPYMCFQPLRAELSA